MRFTVCFQGSQQAQQAQDGAAGGHRLLQELVRAAAAGQSGRRRRRDAGCGARNGLVAAGIGRGRSKCGSCGGLAGGFRFIVGGVRLGGLQPAKRQYVNGFACFKPVACSQMVKVDTLELHVMIILFFFQVLFLASNGLGRSNSSQAAASSAG